MAELVQYYGTGRRKTAVARVFLRPGSGEFKVNGKAFEEYFVTDAQRGSAKSPLATSETAGTFNVGTGFTDAQRNNPPPVGSIITFRFQELTDRGIPRQLRSGPKVAGRVGLVVLSGWRPTDSGQPARGRCATASGQRKACAAIGLGLD